MKLFQTVGSILLTALPAVVAANFSTFAVASPVVEPSGTVTQFQVADATQVPGKMLKPGSYSITVVDHLSDRMVLRVLNTSGKEEATFLAVPGTAKFPSAASSGPVDMKGGPGNKSALRGFRFADGTTAEFVYPKLEAVSLAKANDTTVPAIDPASEGRPDASKLSHNDMELVTLWMLTPTRVGPDSQPGIAAERYQPAIASTDSSTAPSTATEAKAVRPARPAAVRTTPAMKALPHTASSLPLMQLIGLVAFLGAALLRVRRMVAV